MGNIRLKSLLEQGSGKSSYVYSRGEWHNKQDNKPDRTQIKVTKWDAIVDEYNNKDGYEVTSGTNPGLYHSIITNTNTGDYFEITFKRQRWTYYANINGKSAYFDNLDQMIDKFHEVCNSDDNTY